MNPANLSKFFNQKTDESMKEEEARIHFEMSSGERQSDLLVQDCFDGLTLLLHGQFVQVQGKLYPIKVLTSDGKIMLDIRGLPGFDHVEFTMEKTGWGRDVEQPK